MSFRLLIMLILLGHAVVPSLARGDETPAADRTPAAMETSGGEAARNESTPDAAAVSHLGSKSGALTSDEKKVIVEGAAEAKTMAGALSPAAPSVGNSGGVNLAYPIAVLPGRQGTTPPLSLAYSSSNYTNGLVGFGWSLPWIRLVRANPRSFPTPESYGTPNLAASWQHEVYTLEVWGAGQEFFKPSSTLAVPTSPLLPRYESHWKLYPPPTAAQLAAPWTGKKFDQWMAMAPDGTRYYFTNLANDNAPSNVQYIEKILAPDGENNVFFEYEHGTAFMVGDTDVGQRMIYPTKVHYSCKAIGANCYTVEFVYQDQRIDTITGVRDGQFVAITRLLKAVVSKTPQGAIASIHKITYHNDPENQRSQPQHIEQTNGAGESALPPVTYVYQDTIPDVATAEDGATTELKWPEPQPLALPALSLFNDQHASPFNGTILYAPAGLQFADLNRDGLPDAFWRFKYKGRGIFVHNYINQGKGTFLQVDASKEFWLSSINPKGVDLDAYEDAKDEMTTECTQYSSDPTAPAECFEAQQYCKTAECKQYMKMAAPKMGARTSGVQLGDVDGDGLTDMLRNGDPSGVQYMSPNPVNGISDLNGNVQANAPALPVAFYTASGEDAGIRVDDLNGDGHSDLLQGVTGSNPNNARRAWLFDPVTNAFVEHPEWAPPVDFTRFNIPTAALLWDYNHDGLVDIVCGTIYYNTGRGWLQDAPAGECLPAKSDISLLDIDGDGIAQIHTEAYSYIQDAPTYIDIDGDGFVDQVRGMKRIDQDFSTGAMWRKNPRTIKPNLLIEVRHPLGATQKITYATYVKVGEATGAPLTVVTEMKTWSQAMILEQHMVYAYDDPQYAYPAAQGADCSACSDYDAVRGPEFFGFRRFVQTMIGHEKQAVASTNPNAAPTELGRQRTTTIFKKGRPYLGKVESETKEYSENQGVTWLPLESANMIYHDTYTSQTPVSLTPPYRTLLKQTAMTYSSGGKSVTLVTIYPEYVADRPTKIIAQGRPEPTFQDDITTSRTFTTIAKPDYSIVGLLQSETISSSGQTKTVQYEYDDVGRMTREITTATGIAAPLWKKYDYDAWGNRMTVQSLGADAGAAPSITTVTFDPIYHQFPLLVTDPLGHQIAATYYGVNAAEPMVSAGQFGQVARQYTAATATVPAVAYTVLSYDKNGRRQRMQVVANETGQSINERTWEYTPNATAGTYTIRTADKIVWPSYAGQWRLVDTTLDSMGRIAKVAQQAVSNWLQISYEYGGPYGEASRVSQPYTPGQEPIWTVTDYDAAGRKELETTPSSSIGYAYTPFVSRTISGKGEVAEIETDALDRIVRSVDFGGAVTTVEYVSNVMAPIIVTGPDGIKTTFRQNGLGNVTQRSDPNRGNWYWQYNAHGMKTSQTDGAGNVVLYEYDAGDRLRKLLPVGHPELKQEFFYDGRTPEKPELIVAASLGRQSAVLDSSGSTIRHFDPQGNPQTIIKLIGDQRYVQEMDHDSFGRLIEWRDIDTAAKPQQTRFAAHYQYNADGLKSVCYREATKGSTCQPVIESIAYGARGQIDQITYGNQVAETFAYQPQTSLVKRRTLTAAPMRGASTVLLDAEYQHELSTGFLTIITDHVNPQYTRTYSYNSNGSLKSAKSGLYGDLAYEYDPSGNGNMTNNAAAQLLYTDKTHPHAVTQVYNALTGQMINYQYNGNGNVTTSSDRVFTYDALDQLTRLASAKGAMEFFYDAEGRRVRTLTTVIGPKPTAAVTPAVSVAKKTPSASPSPSRQSLPQGRSATALDRQPPAAVHQLPKQPLTDPLLKAWQTVTLSPFDLVDIDIGEQGQQTRRYHIQAMGQQVAMVSVAVGVTPPAAVSGATVSTGSSTIVFQHADQIGSKILLTDQAGQRIGDQVYYTPFGEPLKATGKAQWTEWSEQHEMYAGAALSDIAELYFTGPRTYDPVAARFLQPDQIPGGVTSSIAQNGYSYAMNNPVMLEDSSGLFADVALGIGAMIASAVGSYFDSGGTSIMINSPAISFGPSSDPFVTKSSVTVNASAYTGSSSHPTTMEAIEQEHRRLRVLIGRQLHGEEWKKFAAMYPTLELTGKTLSFTNAAGETIVAVGFYFHGSDSTYSRSRIQMSYADWGIYFHEMGHFLHHMGIIGVNWYGYYDREATADSFKWFMLSRQGMPLESSTGYETSKSSPWLGRLAMPANSTEADFFHRMRTVCAGVQLHMCGVFQRRLGLERAAKIFN